MKDADRTGRKTLYIPDQLYDHNVGILGNLFRCLKGAFSSQIAEYDKKQLRKSYAASLPSFSKASRNSSRNLIGSGHM